MSRPARMCISVDLPDPEGPITAVSFPRATSTRDPAERVDRRLALAVAPCHVARDNDRPVVSAHLSPRLGSFVSTHGGCPSRERGGVRKTLLRGVVRGWLGSGDRRRDAAGSSMRRCASARTSPRMPTISSISASVATSGGEIWTTGSPRSSARQISPASKSAGERNPRSSVSHSSSAKVSLVSLSWTSSSP